MGRNLLPGPCTSLLKDMQRLSHGVHFFAHAELQRERFRVKTMGPRFQICEEQGTTLPGYELSNVLIYSRFSLFPQALLCCVVLV